MLVLGLGLALRTINAGHDFGTQDLGLGLGTYGLDLGLVIKALALPLRSSSRSGQTPCP